jgi:tetratricopeptide (TPR) repeat protein
MCHGINHSIIFNIVEVRLKEEEQKQFFKYLLSNKVPDGNLIVKAILQSVSNQERVSAMNAYALLAQQEISAKRKDYAADANVYLADPETLQQIDQALKIEDEYEKGLILSNILPVSYSPSDDYESENAFEYEFTLMSHVLPDQVNAHAHAGNFDAALNILKILAGYDGGLYDSHGVVALANQQEKEGHSTEARNTISLGIQNESSSSSFKYIVDFGDLKNNHLKNDPVNALMKKVLYNKYMQCRLKDNKTMWNTAVETYLFPDDQQSKKNIITLLDFILHEARLCPDRKRRISIIGQAAVVRAASGDKENALKNLDYLNQLVEEIPGRQNKITAFLEVAKYCSFAGKTDKALDNVKQVCQLIQLDQKEYRRNYNYQEVAHCLITMGLYERAIDMLQNISIQKDKEMVLRDVAMDSIEKSGKISMAGELLDQIKDSYFRDQIWVEIAKHHIKKGNIKKAQSLLRVIESDYCGRIVEHQICLAWYEEGDKSERCPSISEGDLMYNDAEDMAISIMKAGSGETALELVRHNSTDDALFKLANVCLETGNKKTFNDIIPMALKDMSSACKIAGLLCRMHPGSDRDIFKILSSNI